MKKIIGGRRYDTETATKVAEYWNGYSYSDFHYLQEALYRKKNGEFFIHGAGGALTRYSEAVGDLRSGGEKIVPLTFRAAQEWAEKHMDADDFEKLFGEISEGGDRRICTLSLPVGIYEMAKREAAKNGESVSDMVARAILLAFGN